MWLLVPLVSSLRFQLRIEMGIASRNGKLKNISRNTFKAIGDDHMVIPSSPTPRRSSLFALSALKNLFVWAVWQTGNKAANRNKTRGVSKRPRRQPRKDIVERQALGGSNSSLVLGTSLRKAASTAGAFCTAYPQIVPRANSPGCYIGSVIN